MILTEGEKMVWAAAFALECSTSAFPNEVAGAAARRAALSVGAMREAENQIENEDDEMKQMLRAMLGDEG